METLAVVIRVLLILRALFFLAGIALLWFLIAALLFFLGMIGPGLGCLVLTSLAAVARGDGRGDDRTPRTARAIRRGHGGRRGAQHARRRPTADAHRTRVLDRQSIDDIAIIRPGEYWRRTSGME